MSASWTGIPAGHRLPPRRRVSNRLAGSPQPLITQSRGVRLAAMPTIIRRPPGATSRTRRPTASSKPVWWTTATALTKS
ncbi:hypothetical protein [Streptomyces deserti]